METLPSGLPESVGDAEDLARFLTSSGQFNTRMVKPVAFLPNPANRETSVFRHGSEPRAALLDIAAGHLPGDRTLHGAAICKALHVRAVGLEVIAEEPPLRHANIVGWPWSEADPELAKAHRKELAAFIAQNAELIIL